MTMYRPMCRLTDGMISTGSWVQVRGKAMADKAGDLMELYHDVLLTARFDKKDRFKQVSLTLKP